MIDLSWSRPDTALGKLLRAPLRLVPRSLVVRVLQGPLRGARWVVGSGTHGCWLGTYEERKLGLVTRTLKPGDVMYDVGANVGLYTLLGSRAVGSEGNVLAFEPLPRNLVFLERHVELNRCKNVRVFPYALAAVTGPGRFSAESGPSTGRLSPEGEFAVHAVRLDELAVAEGLAPPTVMKIDVEGAEAEVLEGAEALMTASRPVIFLATHGDEVRATCLQWLGERGWDVVPLGAAGAWETDEFVACGRGDQRASAIAAEVRRLAPPAARRN
jgi:FkbM family methyltransferase